MPYCGRTIEIDGFEQDSNSPNTVKTNGHNYLPTRSMMGSVGHTVNSNGRWLMRNAAFPPSGDRDIDVDFKLHAPNNTVVEVSLQRGQLVRLEVTPEYRKADVQVLL